MRAEVRQDDEWRWSDHVPFLDDYLVGRSNKFIVDGPDDLDALRYLLVPPTSVDVEEFKTESKPVLDFAREHDPLVAGGWGVGADLIGWVLVYIVYLMPSLIIPSLWLNCWILLKFGIGLAWKSCSMQALISSSNAPGMRTLIILSLAIRQFIKPILEEDTALAHKYGVKFGYMMTSSCMALLDDIRDAGVDTIMGVDPEQWDLEVAHQKLGGRVCLWGGVNGHLTVELGKPDDARVEVRRAVDTLSPSSGFVLSPVDNVREYPPTAQANVIALIDEWKQITGQ